jgi:hypothetical protein
MEAVPLVGLKRQHNILIVVVFPAPLGPRREKSLQINAVYRHQAVKLLGELEGLYCVHFFSFLFS